MVTAIVLIQTEHSKINDIAETLADIAEISEVYSVSGNYDLVAILRVSNNEDIANVVTGDLVKIDGIQNTETMIAFKAYSKHDLENVFSIGMGN